MFARFCTRSIKPISPSFPLYTPFNQLQRNTSYNSIKRFQNNTLLPSSLGFQKRSITGFAVTMGFLGGILGKGLVLKTLGAFVSSIMKDKAIHLITSQKHIQTFVKTHPRFAKETVSAISSAFSTLATIVLVSFIEEQQKEDKKKQGDLKQEKELFHLLNQLMTTMEATEEKYASIDHRKDLPIYEKERLKKELRADFESFFIDLLIPALPVDILKSVNTLLLEKKESLKCDPSNLSKEQLENILKTNIKRCDNTFKLFEHSRGQFDQYKDSKTSPQPEPSPLEEHPDFVHLIGSI